LIALAVPDEASTQVKSVAAALMASRDDGERGEELE
jgi:hypothetical protein